MSSDRDDALMAFDKAAVGMAKHLVTLHDEIASLRSRLALAQKALEACREGFRLTRDYIGHDRLPAIEGWSWFDADKIAAQALASLSTQGKGGE